MEIRNRQQNLGFGTLHVRFTEQLPPKNINAIEDCLFELIGTDKMRQPLTGMEGRYVAIVKDTKNRELAAVSVLRALGAVVKRRVTPETNERALKSDNNWLFKGLLKG